MKKLIVIVDDETQVLDVLNQLVKRLGYITECFSSVTEAVEKISNKNYDLIILDYLIPNENAEDNIDKILELNPSSKILILSGYDTGQIDNLMYKGVKHFLQKPVTIDELKEKIEYVLDSS